MADKDKKNEKTSSKKHSWFRRMFFGDKKELDFLEEEKVQSPFKTIVKKFLSNKIAMVGVIIFALVFLIVIVGPLFFKFDPSFSESTQQNVGPGFKMQAVPKELKNKIQDIAVGTTFGIGCDTNGKVYTWGKTKVTNAIDLSVIPAEVKNAKIVKVAAGNDHIIALGDDGTVYSWGNGRSGQLDFPSEVKRAKNIKQIAAGYQCSAVVTEDGEVYAWGNTNMNDIRIKKSQEGTIDKIVFTGDALLGLTKEGGVVYLGKMATAYSAIPEGLDSGVVDIASTVYTVAALKDTGEVVVWGSITKGENQVPEFTDKAVSLSGGRYHYNALTESGKIISWGDNYYNQTEVPSSLNGKKVTKIFSGYFQNYAVTDQNKMESWGLKGYLFGTDNLGRDVFVRLINGGKTTMTIGAIAVIISTFIGIAVGSVSGYFGGTVDLILQRLTEIVSSLPFLPFALMLSAVIGSRIPENQRMILIMMVLGLLSWPGLSRLVRAQVLAEREKEFVTAARAMGVKEFGIVFKHILPNVISVIIVTATLDFAGCMLTEASLSYLGFGVQPPTPTWGNMLFGCNNSTIIQYYWWRWVFPSIALGICTICINLIGDGLTDAIDPKSSER